MDYFRIDQVCDVNPPKDIPRFKGMEVSFIPMDAVSTTGEVDVSRTISGDGVKNYSVFQNRDVLFAKITPCMENGKGGIVDDLKNGFGAGSTEFIVIRPDEKKVISEWVQLFLSQSSYRIECKNHMTGSAGQKRVPPKFIAGTVIPVPALDVQRRIVSRIEELFSELDNSVSTLQKTKEQLTVYQQAVLKEAFEGNLKISHHGIDTDLKWATQEETKDLPELSNGWRYVHLSQLGDLGRGRSKHRPRNDKRLFEDGKYPFLQTGEVKAAKNTITEAKRKYGEFGLAQSKMWPKGTLCITIAANIAETAFLGIDACFPDSVVGFTPSDLVKAEYVRFFIESQKLKLSAFAPATAQKNINLETLEKLVIPYCGIQEQQEVIDEIESRLSVCDSIEQTVDTALQQAEAMRQSILKQAFEGRL